MTPPTEEAIPGDGGEDPGQREKGLRVTTPDAPGVWGNTEFHTFSQRFTTCLTLTRKGTNGVQDDS
ncbi:hypothetical protein ABH19_10655 [Leptospirillum sp. Group II 'CF-1']|nr:hypothetical protein ABH19_10655 [Leptospirillum sp. Group II 'CF-1']